jgi:FtsZ-binding cell division protein ZapB
VATRGVDLEPIDRLEEKVKLLVGMIDRLRAEAVRERDENARLRTESARAAEENTRLRSELESARARVTEAEGTNVELTALRDEREQIRGRVAEMLSQIEALNL